MKSEDLEIRLNKKASDKALRRERKAGLGIIRDCKNFILLGGDKMGIVCAMHVPAGLIDPYISGMRNLISILEEQKIKISGMVKK